MRRKIRIIMVSVLLLLTVLAYFIMRVIKIQENDNNTNNTNNINNKGYVISEHPEAWRINDINTYAYIFKEIMNQFNGGVLNDKLWVTDEFRKNYSIDNYGIYLSDLGLGNEEKVRRDEYTFEDTSLADNTQELLDKGSIVFYTCQYNDGQLYTLNRYIFSFDIDVNNKLKALNLVKKELQTNYKEETDEINEAMFNLLLNRYIQRNNMYDSYNDYFVKGYLYLDDLDKIFNRGLGIDNIKLRHSTSVRGRAVFYIKNNSKYYGISLLYYLNDYNKIYNIDTDWNIELTEEQYNSPDIKEDVEW